MEAMTESFGGGKVPSDNAEVRYSSVSYSGTSISFTVQPGKRYYVVGTVFDNTSSASITRCWYFDATGVKTQLGFGDTGGGRKDVSAYLSNNGTEIIVQGAVYSSGTLHATLIPLDY